MKGGRAGSRMEQSGASGRALNECEAAHPRAAPSESCRMRPHKASGLRSQSYPATQHACPMSADRTSCRAEIPAAGANMARTSSNSAEVARADLQTGHMSALRFLYAHSASAGHVPTFRESLSACCRHTIGLLPARRRPKLRTNRRGRSCDYRR